MHTSLALLLCLGCRFYGEKDVVLDTARAETGAPDTAETDADTDSDTDTDTDADTDSDTDTDTDSDTDTDTDTDTDHGPALEIGADAAWIGAPNEDAGRVVRAGDLDGDGDDELVVATLAAESYAGGAYVVDGRWSEMHSLPDEAPRITHPVEFDGAGRSVGVGDVDGDGRADVLVGIPWISDEVVILLSSLAAGTTADAPIRYTGVDGSWCGHGADLADIDGDGVSDALIGCYNDGRAAAGAGVVQVVYGPLAPGEAMLDLVADASLTGVAVNEGAGRHVKGGGDLDGDGIGDLVVPAPWASTAGYASGQVYVVYGPVYGSLSLADADGLLVGEGSSDQAGTAVDMADVNGDGLDDLVIGSTASLGASVGGATYIVHGPASGERGLRDADAVIAGDRDDQQAGLGVAAADLDGDGFAEVFVGAPGDRSQKGAVGLFRGPIAGALTFADADTRWDAGVVSFAGTGLALGDLDADGELDLAVGAPMDGTGGTSAGAVYVVLDP